MSVEPADIPWTWVTDYVSFDKNVGPFSDPCEGGGGGCTQPTRILVQQSDRPYRQRYYLKRACFCDSHLADAEEYRERFIAETAGGDSN